MSDQQITTIGDEDACSSCCKNVFELDLAKNSLSSWDEVKKLLKSLKNLRLLNLSYNPLENIRDSEYYFKNWSDFKQLKILILNSCYINLLTLQHFIEKLSNLNELHLCSNNYNEINFSPNFIKQSLKILYLNNNSFTSWLELCKVGKCFPNLETLVISHNNISDFNDTSELSTQECFKNLQQLIINRLLINDWYNIDQLRKFPLLKHIRIQNIPLLDQYNDEEKYFLLVAHLEGPNTLNGSEITPIDKEKCERAFLRYYIDHADIRPEMRYKELEEKHGKLRKLADVKLNATNNVYVKIKFNDKHTYEYIDVRMTVGEFKKNLEKFVGHVSARFRVFYIDIEAFTILGPEELKHSNRRLYSFNIRDGDEFEIDLKQDFCSLKKQTTMKKESTSN